jgi:hypothetical protein
MIDLKNIHSVTDFQRSPKDILRKLKETQGPVVLTVFCDNHLAARLQKVHGYNDLDAVSRFR